MICLPIMQPQDNTAGRNGKLDPSQAWSHNFARLAHDTRSIGKGRVRRPKLKRTAPIPTSGIGAAENIDFGQCFESLGGSGSKYEPNLVRPRLRDRMRALNLIQRSLGIAASMVSTMRRSREFTCGDCEQSDRCSLPPSDDCAVRAAQIARDPTGRERRLKARAEKLKLERWIYPLN
jgi:hypothetical protein